MTLNDLHAMSNVQDRALQAAMSREVALISDGERQIPTALSLLLVNPAVREALSPAGAPAAPRRRAQADAVAALAAIQRTSFVPLSAACLDDAGGRQVVCAPMAHPASLGRALGRQFVALAARSTVGAASAPFLSPVSRQLSVAFLAPVRINRRLRGVAHLDISVVDTRGMSLVANDTPGVNVQLASYGEGRLQLDSPSDRVTPTGIQAQQTLSLGGASLGSDPRLISNRGHRAMVAQLPLTIGAARRHVAVIATATAPRPDFLNAWSSTMLRLLALALLILVASIVTLVLCSRGVRRELLTDPLTGLRNRRALMEDLPRVCETASEDQPAFLWFCDLNGFKQYNDSFGHVAGDALLARLGHRLAGAVRRHGAGYFTRAFWDFSFRISFNCAFII